MKILRLIALAATMWFAAALPAGAQQAPAPLPTNPLYQQEVAAGQAQVADIPVVRICKGSSTVFDPACKLIAGNMRAFYQSGYFRNIFITLLGICALAGLCWRAVKLMWGEQELNGMVLWLMTRLFITGVIALWSAPTIGIGLTQVMTAMSDHVSAVLRPGSMQLLPQVEVAIYKRYAESDLWCKAVTETLQSRIDSRLHSGASGDFFQKNTGFADRQNYNATLNYGFPVINYGLQGASYQYDQEVYGAGCVYRPAKPYADYVDRYKLYVPDGTAELTRNGNSAFGTVTVRPVMDALESAGKVLFNEGVALNSNSTEEQLNAFFYGTDQGISRYRLVTTLAQAAYLRDHACWVMEVNGIWGKFINSTFFANTYAADDSVKALVDDLKDKMDEIHKRDDRLTRGLGFLIPLAMGFVGFYCTAAIWVMPLCLSIWACFFWLPEELEVSGVLKKGVNWIIVLFFIPLFANMIIDLALGFVDGVTAAITQNIVLQYAAATVQGLAGATLMPDGMGPLSWALKLGAFGAGADLALFTDINIFTGIAWVIAAILVLSTPKITHGLVFGTMNVADSLIQKAALGGSIAAVMAGKGIASAAGTAMSGSDAGGSGMGSGGGSGGSSGAPRSPSGSSGGGGGGRGETPPAPAPAGLPTNAGAPPAPAAAPAGASAGGGAAAGGAATVATGGLALPVVALAGVAAGAAAATAKAAEAVGDAAAAAADEASNAV